MSLLRPSGSLSNLAPVHRQWKPNRVVVGDRGRGVYIPITVGNVLSAHRSGGFGFDDMQTLDMSVRKRLKNRGKKQRQTEKMHYKKPV